MQNLMSITLTQQALPRVTGNAAAEILSHFPAQSPLNGTGLRACLHINGIM